MKRLLAVLVLLLSACAAHESPRTSVPGEPVPPAVARLVDAFSRHDVEAMLREVHPDIEWFLVDGDTLSLEVRGHDAFRASMTGYFASTPDVRSTAEGAVVNGRFVSYRERVRWTKKDGSEGTGASIAVYELENGLVRRAWYFPTEP